MRHRSKNWLRAASVLGLAALLSACCAYERRAPAPTPVYEPSAGDEAAEPMEPAAPAAVENIDKGRLQHWNSSNNWIRHPYR